MDNKNTELQGKIDALKIQIERLEKIDLEKHFDKLQKTLADIFGATNAINLTITNTVQTLTNIVQSLGTIQTVIDANHKEKKQLLTSFSEATEKHLTEQDKQAIANIELLETKIKILAEQNEMLKKAIMGNRIIQTIGTSLLLALLIYLSFIKK